MGRVLQKVPCALYPSPNCNVKAREQRPEILWLSLTTRQYTFDKHVFLHACISLFYTLAISSSKGSIGPITN